MYYRIDRQMKGKELSAQTIASLMVLQGLEDPGQIRSGLKMPTHLLKKLIRNTAFDYWSDKGWLQASGDFVSLTHDGGAKVAARISGQDGGYSVGRDQVLHMADIIRRGERSPFAAGEALERIAGQEGDAPAREAAPKKPLSPAPTRTPASVATSEPRVAALRPTTSAKALYNRLEDLGRVQLSKTFYMRDFLYSEIAYAEGIPNLPEDPELAVKAGRQLCELVLEPLQASLGRLNVRSAYRSPAVNAKGAENGNQYNCASNECNRAGHIWDLRDDNGQMGATACVIVPSFQPYYEKTGDWTALAWWIYDNVPTFHNLQFFPRLAAFNVRWLEGAPCRDSIKTYVRNPHTGDKAALVVNRSPSLDSAAREKTWRGAFR